MMWTQPQPDVAAPASPGEPEPEPNEPPPAQAPDEPAASGTPQPDADGCFDGKASLSGIAKARRDQALNQAELWKRLAPPPAAWLACKKDDECRTVELGCCDHCNNGRLGAVNAQYADQATAKYKPKTCNQLCTERDCQDGFPLCNDGKCTYYRGWSMPSVCADKGKY